MVDGGEKREFKEKWLLKVGRQHVFQWRGGPV